MKVTSLCIVSLLVRENHEEVLDMVREFKKKTLRNSKFLDLSPRPRAAAHLVVLFTASLNFTWCSENAQNDTQLSLYYDRDCTFLLF